MVFRSAHDRGRLERARATLVGTFVAIRLRQTSEPHPTLILPRQTCACAIERSTLRRKRRPATFGRKPRQSAIPSRSGRWTLRGWMLGMIRLCGHVAPHFPAGTAQTSLHRSPIGLSGLQVLAKFPGDAGRLPCLLPERRRATDRDRADHREYLLLSGPMAWRVYDAVGGVIAGHDRRCDEDEGDQQSCPGRSRQHQAGSAQPPKVRPAATVRRNRAEQLARIDRPRHRCSCR